MNRKLVAVTLIALVWSRLAFCGEIHDAANKGDLEKVKVLLNANPDLVNSKDRGGEVPLHWAIEKGNKEVVELLITCKADVNAKNERGETPLHWAVHSGRTEMVELLLANKADVNAQDSNGWTPLYAAAFIGRKEIVELLLANGADVNAKANGGWTPMRGAASNYGMGVANGHETEMKDMVELLRQHGGHE